MHALCFRTFGFFVLAMLCAVVLDSSAGARELAAIKASGKIIVAVPDLNVPPFFFEQGGELKGIDIDLAKSIAERLGVKVEFNREGKSFNDAVELVVSDRADMVTAKISRTFKRAERVLFTDPYVVLQHALLVNRMRFAEISRDKPVAEVVQNYTGTIGVIAKSSFAEYARTIFSKATIVQFNNWDDVVEAVSKGTVSAAYRDAFEVRLILKILPELSMNVRSVVIDDIQDTIGIAVGPANFLLQNYLNLYLQQNNVRYTSDQILAMYSQYVK